MELTSRFKGEAPSLDPLIKRKISTELNAAFTKRENSERTKSETSIRGLSIANSGRIDNALNLFPSHANTLKLAGQRTELAIDSPITKY